MDIILASKSPRRKELMDLLDISYRVEPSRYEENRDITLPRREQIEKLALGKAKEVFERTSGNRIVIGSDTLVYRDGKFYGKPQTEEKAKEMLKELQGVSHEVMTGLAILVEKDGVVKSIDSDTLAADYVAAGWKKVKEETKSTTKSKTILGKE